MPNIVYIVVTCSKWGDDYLIRKVFTKRDDAETYAKTLTLSGSDEYRIVERTLWP